MVETESTRFLISDATDKVEPDVFLPWYGRDQIKCGEDEYRKIFASVAFSPTM